MRSFYQFLAEQNPSYRRSTEPLSNMRANRPDKPDPIELGYTFVQALRDPAKRQAITQLIAQDPQVRVAVEKMSRTVLAHGPSFGMKDRLSPRLDQIAQNTANSL
jgi:hypothetical protein